MVYDVAIIGAGMSGLAAGIRLAHFEKKVCLVEKHSRIGGLNSYYSRGGRDFDVGLHAVTNYAKKDSKSRPLNRLLRQLRIDYDELKLCEQLRSAIMFNDTTLEFSNDFELITSEIADRFPGEIDGFRKLDDYLNGYNELDLNVESLSARNTLASFITDKKLVDMILCPLMFYGNPKERDMDLWQFAIMFKSIFREGFARPREGVRRILGILEERFKECGGELFLKKPVKSIRTGSDDRLTLTFESGDPIEAEKVISSAGYAETMKLCGEGCIPPETIKPGVMSFMESIHVLDRKPPETRLDKTIIFYNSKESFDYKKPDSLIDAQSGVICCPGNFDYDTPLDENIIRITNISNSDLWSRADGKKYAKQKEDCVKLALNEAVRYAGDFRDSIIFTDSFTPATIERYTGHINGAVYGIENKIKNGLTGIRNLFICGTDQGFLGIIGAMLSGITIANLHALK